MDSAELESRPTKSWRRLTALGLAVVVVFVALAAARNSSDARDTTSLANDDHADSSPTERSLASGDLPGDEAAPLDDGWMAAPLTPQDAATTGMTSPTTRPLPGDGAAGPGDADGPTTTVKPDPLIMEYATRTKGGNPWMIAVGFHDDLWFTEANKDIVGRITTDGQVTEFHTPTPFSQPGPITRGPDGAMWFVETARPNIGRITSSGAITEFPVPGLLNQNWGLATGPDGALWFSSFNGTALVGRITTAGEVTTWPIGTCPAQMAVGADNKIWVSECYGPGFHRVALDGSSTLVTPDNVLDTMYKYALARGPDGALWFAATNSADSRDGRIGRLSPTGAVTWCTLGDLSAQGGAPGMLTAGPDGAIWFTMPNLDKVVRMTPDCGLRAFDAHRPSDIATGPDGNIWFTEQYDKIGRINLSQL